MKNNIPVLSYNTINSHYKKSVSDNDLNYIFKKGCKDYLSARIVNNKYFGIIFKKHKLL
jgi:hypothetical protein